MTCIECGKEFKSWFSKGKVRCNECNKLHYENLHKRQEARQERIESIMNKKR